MTRESARASADALDNLVPQLDSLGVESTDIESLKAAADILRNAQSGVNLGRIEAEYARVLRSLESLELQLTEASSQQNTQAEQALRQGEISEAAAEYYRRLSEQ